jgi:hypothetical protein
MSGDDCISLAESMPKRIHGDEFDQLKRCVCDLLDFMVEQLEAAHSPDDQFAAVTAASGVIPYLKSLYMRDYLICARVALLDHGKGVTSQNLWADLAKMSASDFANTAGPLIENIKALRDNIRQLPGSD